MNQSTDQMDIACKVLGHCGRMLSGSKSGYDRANPGHVVVFNSNVCTQSRGKIWFGDIDVTKDAELLKKLAGELGEDVYVLREYDARFETEAAPRLDRARAIASSTDVVIGAAR